MPVNASLKKTMNDALDLHTTPVLEQGKSTASALQTLVSVQYEGDQHEVNIHFMIIGLTATNFKYYAYCP